MFGKDINLGDLIPRTIEVFEKNYGSEEFDKIGSEINGILDNYIETYGAKKLLRKIDRAASAYALKSGTNGLKGLLTYLCKGNENKVEEYFDKAFSMELKYLASTYLSRKIHIRLLEDGKLSNLEKRLMEWLLKVDKKTIKNIENPININNNKYIRKECTVGDYIKYIYTKETLPKLTKLLYS